MTDQTIGQRLSNGFLGDNYPRNMWWVAARVDEVTTTPMARWILEMPVVLYRTEDGIPVALDDRCPHRWAPLSEGRVDGDQIVCPYHGMRFGTDGACTLVPKERRRSIRRGQASARAHASPAGTRPAPRTGRRDRLGR